MEARRRGLEVVFRSAEPGLLALPWELMRDSVGQVALGAAGISRSIPVAGAAETLEMPGGRLRVLMVISRPAGTRDVGYQMVARPLLERLDAVRGEVDLTVLRPARTAAWKSRTSTTTCPAGHSSSIPPLRVIADAAPREARENGRLCAGWPPPRGVQDRARAKP